MNTRPFSLILAVALASVPAPASAYCILPDSSRHNFLQGPFVEYQAIPVYVDNGVLTMGVGQSNWFEEVAAVQVAIDIINSAGTGAPRLYYADLVTAPLYSDLSFPFSPQVNQTGGIVISNFDGSGGVCASEVENAQNALAVHQGTEFPVARLYFRSGGAFSCSADPDDASGLDPVFWYVNPDELAQNPYGDEFAHDLVGVLVHEMLHALGLGHNNNILDPANCDENHPQAVAFNSVMFPGPQSRPWRRRLKRDDIEGLNHLYGAPERPVFFRTSFFSPPAPFQWTAAQELQAGLRVNTPLGLSGAARTSDDQELAGFTNTAQEVRLLRATWSAGWAGNPPGGTPLVEGGQLVLPVHSWERVAVARGTTLLGESREFVAWLGGPSALPNRDESYQSFDNRVRYRVRRNGAWLAPVFADTVTKYRSYGASYDPLRDVFVLAYIDVCDADPTNSFCMNTADQPKNSMVFVKTISGTSGVDVCTQALTSVGRVLAVGDISCDFRALTLPTSCKIPIATTETNGPQVRIIEGTITDTPAPRCFLRSPTPATPLTLPRTALGAPSSAMNALMVNGPMIIGFAPGFMGPGFDGSPAPNRYTRLITMDRTAQGFLDGGIDNEQDPDETFQTWFWPLRVGGMSRSINVGQIQWHVVTY